MYNGVTSRARKSGLAIFGAGARVDARPSAMSLDWSGGTRLTLLTRGPVKSVSDLVGLFAPAEPISVGTVEQQTRYVKHIFRRCDAGENPTIPSDAVKNQATRSPGQWVYAIEGEEAGEVPE